MTGREFWEIIFVEIDIKNRSTVVCVLYSFSLMFDVRFFIIQYSANCKNETTHLRTTITINNNSSYWKYDIKEGEIGESFYKIDEEEKEENFKVIREIYCVINNYLV